VGPRSGDWVASAASGIPRGRSPEAPPPSNRAGQNRTPSAAARRRRPA
jgi:hypothetical protein